MKLVEKIVMKISDEEYNDILPILKENRLKSFTNNSHTTKCCFLVNKTYSCDFELYREYRSDRVLLPYNKKLFLQYCGINLEETFEEYTIRVNPSLFSSFLAEKELKNRKPLFKTEDNVDVYENDIVHWVVNRESCIKYLYPANFNNLNIELLNEINSMFKVFSTKESAEQYVFENITQRTFDGYDIKNMEDMWVVDTQFFKLHQSVGGHYKKDNGKHLLFKHKGNAINHIVLNKETLSLSDLKNISFNGDEKMRLIKKIKEKFGFI